MKVLMSFQVFNPIVLSTLHCCLDYLLHSSLQNNEPFSWCSSLGKILHYHVWCPGFDPQFYTKSGVVIKSHNPSTKFKGIFGYTVSWDQPGLHEICLNRGEGAQSHSFLRCKQKVISREASSLCPLWPCGSFGHSCRGMSGPVLSSFPVHSSKVSQFLSTFPRRPVREGFTLSISLWACASELLDAPLFLFGQ